MAEITCIPFGAMCGLEKFTINDISADYNDFGTLEDIDKDNAEDYGCGDMRFIPKLAEQRVLDRYRINVDEYKEVCRRLDCLSLGKCGLCR